MIKLKAVYAGSFDPFTKGHLYVYGQAKEVFDEVIVLIADNPSKHRMTDAEKMCSMIENVLGDTCVIVHKGLVADYCVSEGIKFLVRGLRSTSDYLYETCQVKSSPK